MVLKAMVIGYKVGCSHNSFDGGSCKEDYQRGSDDNTVLSNRCTLIPLDKIDTN